MIAFTVDDMTCGHCASTITQAVKALDPGADLRIDLAQHRVEIDPGTASAADLGHAIEEAGYTPVAAQGTP